MKPRTVILILRILNAILWHALQADAAKFWSGKVQAEIKRLEKGK